MEALRRFQQTVQRLAARAVGQDTRFPRVNTGQMRGSGLEADYYRLPVDIGGMQPLQDDTGRFFFLVDFSTVDGGDRIQ